MARLDDQERERRQHRAELLADLLESEVYRAVIVPGLQARMRELEQRAMVAPTLEDLKQYQGGWNVCRQLLDAKSFFAEKKDG